LPDAAIAIVNGEQITRAQLNSILLSWYGATALEEMINTRLLEQEAKRRGITVTDKEIADQIASLRKNTPDLDAQLRQSGVNKAHLNNKLRITLLLRKLIPQKPDLIPDDDLDEVQIRSIVVLFKPSQSQDEATRNEAEARDKIDRIAAEIKGGLDFVEAARKYSEDPLTSSRGGEMEPFTRRSGPTKEIEDAAFAMKPGEISLPIKASYGYHLIKLESRKLGRELPSEEKARRKQQAFEQRLPLYMDSWFNDLKARAKIERLEKLE